MPILFCEIFIFSSCLKPRLTRQYYKISLSNNGQVFVPGAWSLCQTAKHDLAEISFFAYLDIDTIREYLIKQVCEQVSVMLHEGGYTVLLT